MNSHASHIRPADSTDLKSALVEARRLIETELFDDAVGLYRALLDGDSLLDLPRLEVEIMANLGALMLHRINLSGSDDLDMLAESIDLLTRSRAQRGHLTEMAAAVADTNLALAYIRRYRITGGVEDVIAAHFALDGAEALLSAETDAPTLDWLRSVRQLLVDLQDRRKASAQP